MPFKISDTAWTAVLSLPYPLLTGEFYQAIGDQQQCEVDYGLKEANRGSQAELRLQNTEPVDMDAEQV